MFFMLLGLTPLFGQGQDLTGLVKDLNKQINEKQGEAENDFFQNALKKYCNGEECDQQEKICLIKKCYNEEEMQLLWDACYHNYGVEPMVSVAPFCDKIHRYTEIIITNPWPFNIFGKVCCTDGVMREWYFDRDLPDNQFYYMDDKGAAHLVYKELCFSVDTSTVHPVRWTLITGNGLNDVQVREIIKAFWNNRKMVEWRQIQSSHQRRGDNR